jgi:hypothetical protein
MEGHEGGGESCGTGTGTGTIPLVWKRGVRTVSPEMPTQQSVCTRPPHGGGCVVWACTVSDHRNERLQASSAVDGDMWMKNVICGAGGLEFC